MSHCYLGKYIGKYLNKKDHYLTIRYNKIGYFVWMNNENHQKLKLSESGYHSLIEVDHIKYNTTNIEAVLEQIPEGEWHFYLSLNMCPIQDCSLHFGFDHAVSDMYNVFQPPIIESKPIAQILG